MEELPGEFLDNFLGDPGKFQGVFRDSWTKYLVELPAEFLKQLAGKILKEVRWYSWMNSGKILGETSDEFWKEHVSNFRWSSYGIPEGTSREYLDEFQTNSRRNFEAFVVEVLLLLRNENTRRSS